jgi:hypothetical protein
MSYLTGDMSDLSMNKATISLWFLLPSDAVFAVQDRDASLLTSSEDCEVMAFVVPLIMFGTQQTATIWEFETPEVSCPNPGVPDHPFTDSLAYVSGSHRCPVQQSCIGVQCRPGQSPSLYVHIQPNNGVSCVNSSGNIGPGFSCAYPPIEIAPGSGFIAVVPVVSDASYTDDGLQEGAVGNSHAGQHGPFGGSVDVAPDQWHHLLISWGLGAESSHSMTVNDFFANQPYAGRVSTTSTFFCAFDDANKSGPDLPASWIGIHDGMGDPNVVACSQIMHIASLIYDPDQQSPYTGQFGSAATASMGYGPIPASPLWVPGSSEILTQSRGTVSNKHAIMAELQIFTGLTLDTGNTEIRRAFVTASGEPESPEKTHAILGRSPEILLHGTKDWIAGRNTGFVGHFSPTGLIEPYKPDPSLHGVPDDPTATAVSRSRPRLKIRS